MATLTLNYGGRNRAARSVVEMLRHLDFITVTEPAPKARKADPTCMSKEEYFEMSDRRMEGCGEK